MKKVAYIYQTNSKLSYAAKTVSNGFKNAFIDRGDSFRFFDISKLENSFCQLRSSNFSLLVLILYSLQ